MEQLYCKYLSLAYKVVSLNSEHISKKILSCFLVQFYKTIVITNYIIYNSLWK